MEPFFNDAFLTFHRCSIKQSLRMHREQDSIKRVALELHEGHFIHSLLLKRSRYELAMNLFFYAPSLSSGAIGKYISE